MKLQINSDLKMQQLGQTIGPLLAENSLILLKGDLGAGKTTFTKGLAKSLGVKQPVKSPTFTIVREYQGSTMPVFHMDMYRLEDGDTSSIDLDDYLSRNGVTLIEWPDFVKNDLPNEFLEIEINRVDDDLNSTIRDIEINAFGSKYAEILAKIKASQPN